MSIAVFPGSFDPPTNGHLNIIQRASTMFESIDVVIAVNSEKKYLFSQEERLSMLKELEDEIFAMKKKLTEKESGIINILDDLLTDINTWRYLKTFN